MYENEGDMKILKKTKFMQTRFMSAYTCETADDFNLKRTELPHVVLCNRNNTPDPYPVKGTREIFEIVSTNTNENGIFKVKVAELQCSCIHCRNNETDSCTHKVYLKRKYINMASTELSREIAAPLNILSKPELQSRCHAKGLPVSGVKSVLISRLQEFENSETQSENIVNITHINQTDAHVDVDNDEAPKTDDDNVSNLSWDFGNVENIMGDDLSLCESCGDDEMYYELEDNDPFLV